MAVGAGAVKAGAAYVAIFADPSELVRDLKTVEAKIKRFGSGVSSVGASIGKIGLGVASLGAVGLSSLAWPLTLASNMENAEAAFTTLLKDGDKARALLSELQAFAAATPFQFDELADASKKLLAFGSQAGNVQQELRQIGDISSAIGAPIGEIAEIYGKARVQGRLFAEDINQLTGRGIPIIQELAKQFGITDTEVKKLVESGKVNFGNLEKAFASLTTGAGQFAGGMERQSKTLSGTFSTLKDNIIAAFRPFGEALLPAAKTALSIASQAVQTFSRWATENKGLALPLAAASVALIGIGGAAAIAGAAVVALGGVISAVGSVAGVIAAGVAAIGAPVALVVAGVAAGLATIAGYFVLIAQKAGLLGPVFAFLQQSFTRVFAIAQRTIGGVVTALQGGQWGKAAEIAWAGVKLATLAGAQQVLKGIDSLWNNAGTITARFFGALNSLVVKVFTAMPKLIWSALRGGKALDDILKGVIGTAFSGGNLDLAGNLDASVAAARQRLGRLTAAQQTPGQRQPPGSPAVNAALTSPALGNFSPAVAGVVNASARAANANAGGGAAAGAPNELAQLLGVNQAQLVALRRLIAMGGLE